jgi:hypothetical protein
MNLTFISLSNIKSLFKVIFNYHLIFLVNAIILIYTFNLFPLSKFPSYDYFWSDSMIVSRLFDIKNAVSSFTYPGYNFYSGFGIEKISELNMYQNPFNILNLLLMSPLSLINFIIIKNIIFFSLLGFGTAKFLSLYNKDVKNQIFFGITITGAPILWGQIYSSTYLYFVCSVPILLWLFEKYKSKNNLTYHLISVLIINMTGPDIITTMAVFLLYFSILFSTLIIYKNQIKKSQIFFVFATPVMSTLSYTLPFLNYFIQKDFLVPADRAHISIMDYVRFFFANGIHTFIYPKEGSAINLYVPISLYFIIIYLFYKLNRMKINVSNYIKYFCVITITYTLIPVIIYAIPPIADLFPSYLRFQFALWPIFIWILTSLIISQIIIPKLALVKIFFLSIFFEAYWFIYNPFDHFNFFNPFSKKYMSLNKWLGTHNNDPIISNIDNLKIPYLSSDSQPWLIILISHGIFLLVLYYVMYSNIRFLNKKNAFTMLTSMLVALQMFSSYSDVRKYDLMGNIPLSNNYRIINYENRINKWITKYNINDSNFRVMPSGADYIFYNSLTARNTKTMPDLELNNLHNIKIPFQYREINSENTSLLYGQLYCPHCTDLVTGAFFPPTNEMLVNNTNWLSDTSVKFIISADEKIYSDKFKLLDSYTYQKPFIEYDYTESGVVYLYEYLGYIPLATSDTGERFRVFHKDVNTISISIDGFRYKKILLNYEYNSKLQALSDGEKISIYERSNGLIEVYPPENASEIIIRYSNNYFNWSSIFSIVYFIFLIIYIKRKKLNF